VRGGSGRSAFVFITKSIRKPGPLRDRDQPQLWMRNEATGDPQRVIDFVLVCAKTFGLTGRWGFQWSNTCSRPRINAFAGGAHVLDLDAGETVAWISTHRWLAEMLDAGQGGKP
jgi:hypothetical protein